jgi:acyl-coenzyme A synthetase/AMP-(fatty) acid ligase/aryl carrier-like protein
MAPLGFDASTLEIFAPLMAGGCVEIYPDPHVVPSAFAEFLESRCITGLWLSAGLFRLVADYRPDAFVNLRQVLTGGDVVPPEQVRRVLRACPGLRVTNGYGPTECTTFTTAHHVEDPVQVDDPLPIGRPIQGTGVVVLDETCRMVPPGAIGELYIYGDGLALDYAGLSEETAAAFGRFSPELDERLYRTGDLVRWDTQGHLRFLGRRDRQVKIRGFRIELDGVARTLREYPGIHDAVVVPTVSEAGDRRLIAGVVAPDVPGLRGALREFAAQRLPDFAIPSLWAIVDELPITANGKLDVARLERLAQSRPPAVDPAPDPTATVPNELHDIEGAIAATWGDVLGARGFGGDERFFDVGGDSLQLLRVVASLRRSLAEYEVTLQELRAHPTIRGLALHLLARSPRQRKVAEDRPGGADAMVRSPAE